MEAFAIAFIIIAGFASWNAKEWIEAYWNGKAEARREERLTAEAKVELARIHARS